MDAKTYYTLPGVASGYLDWWKTKEKPFVVAQTMIQEIKEINPIHTTGTFVDLGSGPGTSQILFLREFNFSRCILVDISEEMFDICKKEHFQEILVKTEFLKADLETDRLNISDATADMIVASCILNYLNNVMNCLEEANRILKPGGIFSFNIMTHGVPSEEPKTYELENSAGVTYYLHSLYKIQEFVEKYFSCESSIGANQQYEIDGGEIYEWILTLKKK